MQYKHSYVNTINKTLTTYIKNKRIKYLSTLLVGYGYWGKNLARNFASDGDLTAICDTSDSALVHAQRTYPDVKLYQDYAHAIIDASVNNVVIATPAQSHYKLAEQAMIHGRDVWIEKPVCCSLHEIESLKVIAKEHGRIIFVDHTFCYNPAVVVMKELLGEIGRPLYYSSTRIGLGLFQEEIDVSLDLGIHCLSILDYLYPGLELVDKTIIKHTHVGEVPDQVLGDFVYADGFTAHINCNWISPVKKRSIILTGEKGSIVYDDIAINKLSVYEAEKDIDVDYNANSIGNVSMPYIDSTEALYNAKKEYLRCVGNHALPLTNIDNTTKIMQWLLA